MQLSPALQSLFSFHLGCGYDARKKKKRWRWYERQKEIPEKTQPVEIIKFSPSKRLGLRGECIEQLSKWYTLHKKSTKGSPYLGTRDPEIGGPHIHMTPVFRSSVFSSIPKLLCVTTSPYVSTIFGYPLVFGPLKNSARWLVVSVKQSLRTTQLR